MEELINKQVAIEQIKSIPYATQEEVFFMSAAVSRIRKMPTTTQAEIRAKAIEEFAEKFIYKVHCEGCSGCTNCYETGTQDNCDTYRYYVEIAEQLKGEQ